MKRVLFAGTALLMLACGAPRPDGSESRSDPTFATPPQTAPAAPTTAAAPTTTAAPAAPQPYTSFPDGTYEVGSGNGQVAPGTYKVVVPGESSLCYWERVKDLSGEFGAIIANGTANPGTQVLVTIKPTDKGFTSRGCGNWRK